MRPKHQRDKNNGKNGCQSGNKRYNRNRKSRSRADRTMGKCRSAV